MAIIEATPRSGAQQRLIDTALELISEHGVSGTSLQMIADALGVTKAAVYHQFRTKEEIVLAAVEAPMRDLAGLVDRADRAPSGVAALEVIIDGFADIVVRHRHTVGSLQGDPVMTRLIKGHGPYADVVDHLRDLLTGGSDDPAAVVRAGMLWHAVMATGAQDNLADVDGNVLRRHLRAGGRSLVGLPGLSDS